MQKKVSITFTQVQAQYLLSLVEDQKDKFESIDLNRYSEMQGYLNLLKQIEGQLRPHSHVART